MLKEYLKKIIGVGTNNEINRIEWIANELKNLPPGHRLLDAGAGERRYEKFCGHLKYVAQDFGQYNGEGDGRGLQTKTWDQTRLDIICDITAIPEPNESFDAILCAEVLEHIPDPAAAIKELSRLLKPGGKLIVTAPFCSATHFAPFHFSTGFNRYWYEKYLPQYSLNIVKIEANGNWFEYIAQELLRTPLITKRFSKKRLHWWDYLSLGLVIVLLKRLNKKDIGSAEFLNFGYHLLAIKK